MLLLVIKNVRKRKKTKCYKKNVRKCKKRNVSAQRKTVCAVFIYLFVFADSVTKTVGVCAPPSPPPERGKARHASLPGFAGCCSGNCRMVAAFWPLRKSPHWSLRFAALLPPTVSTAQILALQRYTHPPLWCALRAKRMVWLSLLPPTTSVFPFSLCSVVDL